MYTVCGSTMYNCTLIPTVLYDQKYFLKLKLFDSNLCVFLYLCNEVNIILRDSSSKHTKFWELVKIFLGRGYHIVLNTKSLNFWFVLRPRATQKLETRS